MGKKTPEPGQFSWEPFRRGYRFVLDECYKHEGDVAFKKANLRFYERIPTKCGGFVMLCHEGPVILAWWTPGKSPTAQKVFRKFKDVPGFSYVAYGGYEAELRFPGSHLKQVLPLVGARTKRQMSPEQKEKAVAVLKAHQFRKKPVEK